MLDAKPAVFLDRDGVINADRGFVGSVSNFELVKGVARAIALLNRSGFLVFVVTNQSGIGRGYFTVSDYHEVTSYMMTLLAAEGAHVDDIRYCPYHPEAAIEEYRESHPWRKPAPGMILDLLEKWPIQADASFLIGDSVRDIQAAQAAGIEGFLFGGGDVYDFLLGIKPALAKAN